MSAAALLAIALLFVAPSSAIAAEPVVTSSLLSCNVGPILKTFGKADWLVKVCSDGSLMFLPAPKNGASHPFTYHYGEMETPSPYLEERFRDKRARAAYLEVKALTTEQFDALVREIRASVKG